MTAAKLGSAEPSHIPAALHPALQKAFTTGERLVYAVSYMGLRGGTVTMEVQDAPHVDGRPVYKLRTKAVSEQPVTSFFPVDDRVVSTVDAETLLPLSLSFHKKEGRKQSTIDVLFHHEEGTATTIKDGTQDITAIPPVTQHAFSALYYLRSLPLVTVGDEITLNVHHEKKNYPLHAKVEGSEQLDGDWGTQRTLRVVVTMPYTGIWLNAGNMTVWVTDNQYRLPLKIQAKMVLGSVVARLIEGPNISSSRPDESRASQAF